MKQENFLALTFVLHSITLIQKKFTNGNHNETPCLPIMLARSKCLISVSERHREADIAGGMQIDIIL